MIRPEMQWLLFNEIAVFEDFNHQHFGELLGLKNAESCHVLFGALPGFSVKEWQLSGPDPHLRRLKHNRLQDVHSLQPPMGRQKLGGGFKYCLYFHPYLGK